MKNLARLNSEELGRKKHELEWALRDKLSGWIKNYRLKTGEIASHQDTEVENFYVLRNGLLGVYRTLPSGKSILVEKVLPGELVGLTHLLLGDPFPARLEPITESVVLRGNGEDVETLERQNPNVLTEALLNESYVFTNFYEKLEAVLSRNTEQRIGRELLELAGYLGRETEDGIKILAKLCRKDFAQMVGCAHESASRVMSDMEKNEIISTRRKYITLKKPHDLLRLVEETG